MQGMELENGTILEGKVTGITKFGAFVSLPGGRSGLVHISEVAYSYVNDVNEFLKVGDDVKVKVINIDDNNRINLSIKQTLPPPARPERSGRGSFNGNREDRGDRGGNRRGGFGGNREERAPRENRENRDNRENREGGESGERFERRGNDRGYNNNRPSRPANIQRNAPKEPMSFEDMMKQYMSESETKFSQLNRGESRPRRRRGRGNNN